MLFPELSRAAGLEQALVELAAVMPPTWRLEGIVRTPTGRWCASATSRGARVLGNPADTLAGAVRALVDEIRIEWGGEAISHRTVS